MSVFITHPRAGDVFLILSSPVASSGPTFSLLNLSAGLLSSADFGAGSADADRCTLDDTGPAAIQDAPSPRAGTFRPWADFTAFPGTDPTGTWTIQIQDTAAGNVGTFEAASVFITVGGVETRFDVAGLPSAIPDAGSIEFTFDVGALGPPPPPPDQFVVQITPLIRPDPGFVDEADIITVTQFADLEVVHPVCRYKTAKVTLSMHDPAVAGLEPFAFALRVLYQNRLEPVFWGQANITEDYAAETVTIEAQDPSLRMMHHYLRRGDAALNSPTDPDKGSINPDATGVKWCVDAAQNVTSQDDRNDPSLGLTVDYPGSSTPVAAAVEVERGQETWQVVTDLIDADGSPDLDMQTPASLNNYTIIVLYDEIGVDRTSATPDTPATGEVVFDLGLGADNCVAANVNPGRPTTHDHTLSEDAKYRVTAADTTASHATGGFIDWTRTGFTVLKTPTFPAGDTTVLQEVAKARVKAYGKPPKFTTIVLRPDAVLGHNYGRPSFTAPPGTKEATFYTGDYVTVRALVGERSVNLAMEITETRLTWQGWQGPALTGVTMVPVSGNVPVDEES